MTGGRLCGAAAAQTGRHTVGASARPGGRLLLLLVAGLGLLARPAAAQTEVVEYYGHDALGSIRIVFTASGVATARADYEPFGEAVTIAGMPAGPLPAQQFTGQERDALERQDYFGARYYRPRHGRFAQVDPVYAGLFDPQQWNRYAYARNNPLGFVDPDGRNLEALDRPAFRVEVEYCSSCDNRFFIQMQLMWYFPGIYGSGLGAGSGSDGYSEPGRGRGHAGVVPPPPGPTPDPPPPGPTPPDGDGEGPKEPDPCQQPELPPGADVRLNSQGLQRVAQIAPRATLLYWFDSVAPGGRWDYKGKGRRYEVGGNFHYGATGRALGIPEEVLLVAAGAVQTLVNAVNVFGRPTLVLNYFDGKTYTPSSYFDDPADQEAIKAGVKFTEAGCAAKD